jgi:tRNA A37 threonylcarbamoyladenosine synthetase subunit TsaC/SUA5/YrdC
MALDAGDLRDPDALPSTVVDATDAIPSVVRVGSLSVAAIRRVCPVVIADQDQADA